MTSKQEDDYVDFHYNNMIINKLGEDYLDYVIDKERKQDPKNFKKKEELLEHLKWVVSFKDTLTLLGLKTEGYANK